MHLKLAPLSSRFSLNSCWHKKKKKKKTLSVCYLVEFNDLHAVIAELCFN